MRYLPIILAFAFGVTGCGGEDVEDLADTAEIEADPVVGDMDTAEELVLEPTDAGSPIVATGIVAGQPSEAGFFLRTEGDRYIFIETDVVVAAGDGVRVEGTVSETPGGLFEQWQERAMPSGFDPEWEVHRLLYIDAATVSPIDVGASR